MARTKNRQNSSMVVNLPKNHRQNNKSRKTKFQTNLKHIVREQGGFKYWKKTGSRFLDDDERNEVPVRARPMHCLWCEEVFSSVRTLRTHTVRSRACRPYICQCCGCNFTTIRKLADHSQLHPEFPKKTFICRSCDQHFEICGTSRVLPGDEEERLQIASGAPMEVDGGRRPFEVEDTEDEEESLSTMTCTGCTRRWRVPCPFCKLSFPDFHSMTAHCVVHAGYFLYEYACDACERVFASLPALEEHLSWHDRRGVFLCPVCGERFGFVEDREWHLEQHALCQNLGELMLKATNQNYVAKKKYEPSSPLPLIAPAYYCVDCDFSCSTKTGIRVHYDSVHPTLAATSRHEESDEDLNDDEATLCVLEGEPVVDLSLNDDEAAPSCVLEGEPVADSSLNDDEMSPSCVLEGEPVADSSLNDDEAASCVLEGEPVADSSLNDDEMSPYCVLEGGIVELESGAGVMDIAPSLSPSAAEPEPEEVEISLENQITEDASASFTENGERAVEVSQKPTSSTAVTMQERELKKKKKKPKGKWLRCPFCKRHFKSVQSVIDHCSVHKEYVFYEHPCRTCGKMIKSFGGLVSHAAAEHGQQLTMCGVCGIELPNKTALTIHRISHTDVAEIHQLMSKKTNRSFGQKSSEGPPGRIAEENGSLDRSMSVLAQPSTSQSGGGDSNRPDVGQLIPANHVLIEQPRHCEVREFRCKRCSIGFTLHETWEEHSIIFRGKLIFVCCLCGQVFNDRLDRDSHKMSHGEDSQTNPPYEAVYVSAAQAKQENEPLMCKYCNKVFLAGTSRRRHLIEKHLPWRCEQCPMQYDNKRRLAYHIRTRHAAKLSVLNLYCDICKRHFKNLIELESDLSSHESNPVFLCCICALDFDSYRERELHLDSHKAYRT